jgi:hypothetical protein
MSETEWQIGIPTGNLLATYRGIRIVVRLDRRGNPVAIEWFIEGRLAESTPVGGDLESAKKIGIDVVDERIPMDDQWSQAEKDNREDDLWRQSPINLRHTQ